MAKSLRLKVIAEGVETEEQLCFLRRLQCDEIQGYYFSKPISADEAASMLSGQACLTPGRPSQESAGPAFPNETLFGSVSAHA
jgi:predicted signal transduction protein with EAL and GGDEF domain